jgi:hypothetical protein
MTAPKFILVMDSKGKDHKKSAAGLKQGGNIKYKNKNKNKNLKMKFENLTIRMRIRIK